MIQKLLIANRGEIACRIIRTARRMSQTRIPSTVCPRSMKRRRIRVCVFSSPDHASRPMPRGASQARASLEETIRDFKAGSGEISSVTTGILTGSSANGTPKPARKSRSHPASVLASRTWSRTA